MKILILTGGNSSEREVSLISAKSVSDALKENYHTILHYDLSDGFDSITELSQDYDVLFPVLHGEEGESGKLHEFLNKLNKPIVGTKNHIGLQGIWPKINFKIYCDKNNIPTSEWEKVETKADILKFGFPCVLKNSLGGSSREIVILKSKSDFNEESKRILKTGNAFVEKYLSGIEITVGILNNKALPVIEIIPVKDSWFSYKTKYDGSTKEIPFAPSVDKKVQQKAQEIALKIHNHFNLGTYSRTDFIVHDGIPYALEINTIPGLTSESLMPKAAKAAGIDFKEFLNLLIENAK